MSTRRKAPRRLPDYPPKKGDGAANSEKLEGEFGQENVYRDAVASADPATLDRMRRIKLMDEIIMLRLVMRRVIQQAAEQEPSLDTLLSTLNSLSLAAMRLSRLLNLELTLAESEDNSLALLAQAINEVMAEKGW